MRSRLVKEERGVAMVVMMAVLALVLIISATAAGVALTAKGRSSKDRSAQQALQAAEAGLSVALYQLNEGTSTPLADSACPAGNGTDGNNDGWCDTPVTNSFTLGNNSNYTYYVSVATSTTGINSSTDFFTWTPWGGGTFSCAGADPKGDHVLRPNLALSQRCVTSTGTVNGIVARIQARVIADQTETQFPIPGLLGYDHLCLSCNTGGSYQSPTAGTTDTSCQNRPQTGGQDQVVGVIGSNKAVFANLSSWSSSGTITQKYVYVPVSNTCVNPTNYAANVASWFPGVKPDALRTVPIAFPSPDMNGLFRNPGADATSGSGTYTAQRQACQATNTDISVCNDNAINKASGASNTLGVVYPDTGVNKCNQAPTIDANRVLNIPSNCQITINTGTYDFCGISFQNNGAALQPQVTSGSGASVVRIFIDSFQRTRADGSRACPSNASNTVNGNIVSPGGASFMSQSSDPKQAQIFMYGNPSSPSSSFFSFANSTAFSFLFKGPSTTFQLQNTSASGTPPLMSGGVAAWGIEFQNNVAFQWDPRVDSITTGGKPVYYKQAWEQCNRPATTATPTSGC